MTISYSEALATVRKTASQLTSHTHQVPVHDAVGRIGAEPCLSSRATPFQSTSAMDGFLVQSSATNKATTYSPAIFTVIGTIVPGQDLPKPPLHSEHICYEIMTGGAFPDFTDDLGFLDACVPVEHAVLSSHRDKNTGQLVKSVAISQPVIPGAHQRKAGTDIPSGQIILQRGQRITSSHLLPLLAAHVETVSVVARPRIGIWSTGSEFNTSPSKNTIDINGPYLTALCKEIGADVTFLGHLPDDLDHMSQQFLQAADSDQFDILITTGAVSVGKFDFVRPSLLEIGAKIAFHGVNIRPGHPMLFASLPSSRPVAFFGLPGNPGAVAACFRFFVIPFFEEIQKQDAEPPVRARAVRSYMGDNGGHGRPDAIVTVKHAADYFVPGRLTTNVDGDDVVEVHRATCSATFKPFISANCWTHIHGHDLVHGESIDCYPLH